MTHDLAQSGLISEWVDDNDLAVLRESISGVLGETCTRSAVHESVDGKRDLSGFLWHNAVELGWLAIGVPEIYGGLGMGAKGLDLLHQELGAHLAPGPFLPALAAARALSVAALDDVRKEWLPRLAAGEVVIAIPLSFDPNSVMVVNGKTLFLGSEGASMAVVPNAQGGWVIAPFAGTRVDFWDRTRYILEASIDPRDAIAQLSTHFGDELATAIALAVAADSVGLGRAALAQTVEFMQTRVQFGQPIGAFQALKHRAAEIAARIRVAELSLRHAVESVAAGEPDSGMWALLAKVTASDAAVFAAAECTLLHGGVGFTWEFDLHLFLKRAQLNTMLIAPNHALLDRAAAALVEATEAGRNVLELSDL